MEQHERRLPLRILDEDAALRALVEGTSAATGPAFFAALVKSLAQVLDTHGAWVTEYLEEERRLRALAFWLDGRYVYGFEYCIDGTPCESVVSEARLVHIPDNLLILYPNDADAHEVGAVSYLGVPLCDVDGRVLGHLSVLDTEPLPEEPRCLALFHVFAARAAAELQRLRAERQVRERETKLRRLVDSAMDAIVELDDDFRVTMANAAAETVFGCAGDEMAGQDFRRFLGERSRRRLTELAGVLCAEDRDRRHAWIAEGLEALRADGQPFAAEATLSCFEAGRERCYTLILRDIHDRLEAERRIRSLSTEAEYLREAIAELRDDGEVLGRSRALLHVLQELGQVAQTNATVLIMGETGTGKERLAQAVHASSRRRDRPLIKVNCAAIPAALIESEFFGHETGAFTGATKKRDGRFALADGGTIFLDEVGELPLELQPKLLRVLQEGEFEPIGSSVTRKVDVRVIAATNRDLLAEVRAGRFREDLYYRLSVFPIEVPPLRARPEDIPVLAEAFAQRCAQRLAVRLEPLSPACLARLCAYDWPGNVRELQNVIERAVITSRDGRLNLDRALPGSQPAPAPPPAPATALERVLTVDELREVERQNLLRALEETHWRIAGACGAASRIGVPPSTFTSRMKALGIRRR